MVLALIFTAMMVISLVCGAVTGNLPAVSAAAMTGAGDGIMLSISLAGVICIFSGFMTLLERSGLSKKLAVIFRPIIKLLFPKSAKNDEVLFSIAANMSANMLGLGNAATPLGIRAARQMAKNSGGRASDELCRLVVLNTASIQLLPTTVAAIRLAAGAKQPFDILPAVWFTSALSVAAGLTAAKLMERFTKGD